MQVGEGGVDGDVARPGDADGGGLFAVVVGDYQGAGYCVAFGCGGGLGQAGCQAVVAVACDEGCGSADALLRVVLWAHSEQAPLLAVERRA